MLHMIGDGANMLMRCPYVVLPDLRFSKLRTRTVIFFRDVLASVAINRHEVNVYLCDFPRLVLYGIIN
jgi:hypothetical protein